MTFLKLIRAHQYLKNIFIFAPLFFSGLITDIDRILDSIIIFILFSIVASSVYIFNDINDIEEDKKHFKKKNRPIASGKVKISQAVALMILFLVSSLSAIWFLYSTPVFLTVIFYVVMNLIYSLKIKKYAIYDIVFIAIGFVSRLFIGSFATGLELSNWIVVLTFFLALFLVSSKRRAEFMLEERSSECTRIAMRGYTLPFLDLILGMTMTISIVSYLMYTIVGGHSQSYLYLTTIWVFLGFLRFSQMLMVSDKADDPTKAVSSDWQIRIIALTWILNFGAFLYV